MTLGLLRLPCFAERNFGLASREVHNLWIESDGVYSRASERLRQEKSGEESGVSRGWIRDHGPHHRCGYFCRCGNECEKLFRDIRT